MQWNCNGGVLTSITDENSQPTTFSYTAGGADPFWRIKSTTDALNNTTNYSYSPTSVESVLTFNSGASTRDTLTTVDGLGRVKTVQKRQARGSANFDTISRTYDGDGRLGTVSMPCTRTAGASCPTTPAITYSYDGLNRTTRITDGGGGYRSFSYAKQDVLQTLGPAPSGEHTKQRQFEHDGLGRLVSVCEITNASGSGSCGQANTSGLNFTTAYVTGYTYDALGNLKTVTQGTQTRNFNYDGLSRMTQETNPESGTTTYFYDTDSTCGTSRGDLVKTTDAAGNLTCSQYDARHRATRIYVASGSYASGTPDNCSVYDSATVNGVTLQYSIGRLAEAYTVANNAGCSASKITDLGFSYSARGEATDFYESTPHSGGYYHTGATYWADGALASLGGLSGVPTFTTTVEGEGRVSGVNASFGPSPVVSLSTYAVSGKPAYVYLGNGSGDYDRFLYDSNTDRVTQYAGWINSQWVYGNLGWNANGTLSSLATFDPFNSGVNNRTCNYVYDDLPRLASDNCGSVWSQTFSYDPFGNLTKSGSISWMPGYNSATNLCLPKTPSLQESVPGPLM
jgi:YD repeat-containing protein